MTFATRDLSPLTVNKKYNQAYLDEFYKDSGVRQNNLIVLNFEVKDLKQEYD